MGISHKQCLLFFHKVSPSKNLEHTCCILYIRHLKLVYMIVIQIRCYGSWSRACMLAVARGSQSRFLPHMVRRQMFDFVCRKMKIQEDTFYTTKQRDWDQFRRATANEQKKKDNANLWYQFRMCFIIRFQYNYSV